MRNEESNYERTNKTLPKLWHIHKKEDLQEGLEQMIDNKNTDETITFGTYPQTADGTDKTPIQWRVLENSNKELFILSEYILDQSRPK